MSDTVSHVSKTNGHVETSPARTVMRFLQLLQERDVDGAAELLSPDVRYINVSLPTIRGRDRVRRALKSAFGFPGAAFEVYIEAVAADGGTVLTERTDVLVMGPVRLQFWVCGRFDVHEGQITLWRDYFDWWNITVATVRGVLGALLPPLRAKPPRTTPPHVP